MGTVSISLISGTLPPPPSQVTSIVSDAAATVSFLPPTVTTGITSYTVTPYIAGAAQTPTTVTVGSLTTLAGSTGQSFRQAAVAGLTNGTAYTFTVHSNSTGGASVETSASGANTPRVGLVFGDEFNGAFVDPEWWIYSRAGFIAQSETEWYLPAQCVLDGSGNMSLTAIYSPVTGASYASNGGGTVTQHWTSGACQNNTRSFGPSADGNTLTIETRFKVCAAVGLPYTTKGMWPGLVWCEGTDFQTAWKTDPAQATWNNSGKWEIDIAEIGSNGQTSGPNGGSSSSFLYNTSAGSFGPSGSAGEALGFDAATGFHVYSVTWKGTALQANRVCNWYTDSPYVAGTGPAGGTLRPNNISNSGGIAVQTSKVFLNVYLQVLNTATSDPGIGAQTCLVDYIRVYDQLI